MLDSTSKMNLSKEVADPHPKYVAFDGK